MSTENDHKTRQMWFVIDGNFLLAPFGYPYSHYEWLHHLFQDEHRVKELYKHCARGYVRDSMMVAYTEVTKFSRYVKQADLATAYKVLKGMHNLQEFRLGLRNDGTFVCEIGKDDFEKWIHTPKVPT